jgi:hypothetical protein
MNQPFVPQHLQPVKKFLFNPQKLNEIRKKAIGLSHEEAIRVIIEELDRAYPGHICKKQNWIFNNAGGAMGQLALLHASIREYIIIFGTCIGTEGHSGRYASEVYDYVFKGEVQCEYEGKFQPEINTPESEFPLYLGSGKIKHYCIKDEAWMLEYARGNIPKMFPFGTFDSIFSTLDLRTIGRLIVHYARLTIAGLLFRGKDLTAVLKFIAFAAIAVFLGIILAKNFL